MLNRILKYLLFKLLISANLFTQITIDTNYEGANSRILNINNAANTVKIESQLRSGDVHNVVFYLKISGFNTLLPLKIQVKYSQQYYVPVLAAYSYDGVNWSRITGTFSGDSKEFSAVFPQNSIYFAHGFPYVYNDLLNLENRLLLNPYTSITNIAVSHGGGNIKLFTITEPCVHDSDKQVIWILGRNHAMESHSNYILEGLIDFLVSGDFKADMLRRQSIIKIVPMMDVDKAFNGGTGKDQLPVDFNRDWDSPSYWPAVIAVKQKITESAIQNHLRIFIDSHNPFPGQNDNNTWFYSRQESGPRSINLDFYRRLLNENGGYVFNRQPLYATDGQTSASWVDSVISNIDFSTSLETGWVTRTDNVQWTLPLYKLHGAVIGKGMADYINNLLQPGDIILDNTDTLAGVTINGAWSSSTFIPGYWGINYLHDGNSGQGSKSVKYTPQIPGMGYYEVFIRYTSDAGRSTIVPVKLVYSGGIKDTIINQEIRGSQWLSLGMYRFDAGNTGSVTVSNSGANDFVIADAVKFSPRNNCNPIGFVTTGIPVNFSLKVYPNPFNPSVNFELNIPSNSDVEILIYDVTGKLVKKLMSEKLFTGIYTFNFNGENLSSGIYFYKTVIKPVNGNNPYFNSGKLVLIK
ncbi:MAG: exopolysaccharide biosynthesis protein [Chlorobi bacterium OLB5]|nr:MAG: exopolysaccharide biosynthesis protein [Chlorobi bacterium OLB5]